MSRLKKTLLLHGHCLAKNVRVLGSISVLAANVLNLPAATAAVMTIETVNFITNVVPNSPNDRPVMLQARIGRSDPA